MATFSLPPATNISGLFSSASSASGMPLVNVTVTMEAGLGYAKWNHDWTVTQFIPGLLGPIVRKLVKDAMITKSYPYQNNNLSDWVDNVIITESGRSPYVIVRQAIASFQAPTIESMDTRIQIGHVPISNIVINVIPKSTTSTTLWNAPVQGLVNSSRLVPLPIGTDLSNVSNLPGNPKLVWIKQNVVQQISPPQQYPTLPISYLEPGVTYSSIPPIANGGLFRQPLMPFSFANTRFAQMAMGLPLVSYSRPSNGEREILAHNDAFVSRPIF
jgi:hypothetical protein